ncbi:MAG TPA: hypothetical protein VFW92_06740 [Candidatus Limnocylindrales bacterium]|jgi:hypothetical protein|nr:hypothetical protein [Candidatus Limnocylindrales bacterium]
MDLLIALVTDLLASPFLIVAAAATVFVVGLTAGVRLMRSPTHGLDLRELGQDAYGVWMLTFFGVVLLAFSLMVVAILEEIWREVRMDPGAALALGLGIVVGLIVGRWRGVGAGFTAAGLTGWAILMLSIGWH